MKRAWLTVGVVVTALTAASDTARGHVRYVTDGPGPVIPIPQFVVEVLSNPLNSGLIVGGGLFVLVALGGYLRFRPATRDISIARQTLREYGDLVPWLLRLSIGLPLVGAGFTGYFFSPAVPPFIPVIVAPSRLFQITIGFLLLFGLATRAAALVGLTVYLVSVPFFPDLVLANEYVSGFLAILLLGSGRPSADQLLRNVAEGEGTAYGRIDPVHGIAEWLNRRARQYEDYAVTIVRVGLGLNFVYLGLFEKILNPGRALKVVEKYDLTGVIPVDPGMWVIGTGLTEIAVGMALLFGLFTRGSAAIALVIFTTTLFGIPDDPVLAHITLFGLTSALIIAGSGPIALDQRIRRQSTPVDTTTTGENAETYWE